MPKFEVWITIHIAHSQKFEVEAPNADEAELAAREAAEESQEGPKGVALCAWNMDDGQLSSELLQDADYNVEEI